MRHLKGRGTPDPACVGSPGAFGIKVWCLVHVRCCRVDMRRLAETRYGLSTRCTVAPSIGKRQCAVTRQMAHAGLTVEKMMYHSSSPGLRQTQVHRSRQLHIRIRPAAGVRARTRGVGEQRREGVVVHQSDSRCIVAHARQPSGSSRGPGMVLGCLVVEGGRGKDGGASYQFRAPGSRTTLGSQKKFCLQFVAFDRPVSNLSVCVSVCPSLPPLRGNDCRMRYRPDRSD